MKSVGEAMAIGRNFATALQKALRSLEKRGSSFHWGEEERSAAELVEASSVPDRRPHRARAAGAAQGRDDRGGLRGHEDRPVVPRPDRAHQRGRRHASPPPTRSTPTCSCSRRTTGSPTRRSRSCAASAARPMRARCATSSASARCTRPSTRARASSRRSRRTTTRATTSRPRWSRRDRRKVVILGSGPNRIGQGVEFDYSCVHASFALSDAGFETIMINCNPETVSTDYDTSDRLYFEPLTLEDVLEVIHAESQTRRARRRRRAARRADRPRAREGPRGGRRADPRHHAPTRSTSPRSAACSRASSTPPGLLAPRNGTAIDVAGAVHVAEGIGYPVLVRPSYVLGGRGMEIVYDSPSLADYFERIEGQGIVGPEPPAARRPVPRRRDRDRRRRALRRHRALHRRRHGAHRGGRHPLGRLELHAAARHARPRRGRPGARGDPRDRRGHRRARACSTCSSRSAPACSTCSRRTRARAAPCRSCRRRSASRSPRPRRASWSARRSRELIDGGDAARHPTARACRSTRPSP